MIQLIESVPGVRGAELLALYPAGARYERREMIEAYPARWDDIRQAIVPADLLLFEPRDIEVVPSPEGAA